MPEPWTDQLSRVRLMASGDGTWDLSPNDCAALRAVLGRLDATAEELAALRFVHLEARELVGEADAGGTIPQANLDALRTLLWRASIKRGKEGER